jgi:hypothetical protein
VNLYNHCPTRLHGVVLNQLSTGTTLLFLLLIPISAQGPAILTEVSHSFPHLLQVYVGIASPIRLRPLPSTTFPISYSLTILSFDALV